MAEIDFGALHVKVTVGSDPVSQGDWWLVNGDRVELTHPVQSARFYRHGWHSWSLAHWADVAAPPVTIAVPYRRLQADDPALSERTGHAGNGVGAIAGPDGHALVLGALGFDAVVEGTPTTLGGTAAGPVDWFIAHGPAEETLSAYAAALGERLGNVRQDPGGVWCSWYSYYTGITEAEVRRCLEGAAGLGFDVFQIDDGWQVEIGDWQSNDDFPSGMATVAESIHAAGFRPGLWIAPFIAHERSAVFRDQLEWFVSRDGEPVPAGYNWDGPYYALDMTHPEARTHVAGIIRGAVSWGYTYLKLDFIFAAAIPGDRHGPGNREEVYRSGIELIREVAGDDVYLLACGSPIIPSVGVFNGMRVGPDVAPFWENDLNAAHVHDYSYPSTRYAISTSLNRLWLNDVIAVDPDVAYFRTRYNLMDPGQRAMLQDLCHVCGFLATSDPPHWLDPEERERLAAWLAAPGDVERLDRYRFKVDGREVDFRRATLDAPSD